MRKQIISLAIMLISLNFIIAQDINFGIKLGGLRSKLSFQWTESVTNNTRINNTNPSFSIFAEGKITKLFYLGVELGKCSYQCLMDINYTDLGIVNGSPAYNAKVSYLGWYQQEQFYFSINPQFKFGKSNLISVGAGIGLYNNYINLFNNGYYSFIESSNSTSMDLEGHNLYLPNTVFGGHLNVTLNPKITEHLGLVFETKYIFNSPSNGQISKEVPSLSFNSFAILIGLSFHL